MIYDDISLLLSDENENKLEDNDIDELDPAWTFDNMVILNLKERKSE